MRSLTLSLGLLVLCATVSVGAQVNVNPWSSGFQGVLGPGDRAEIKPSSSISQTGPDYYRQRYDFDFQAGQQVVIDLMAPTQDSSAPGYWDTYLILVEPNGVTQYDDDGGDDLNARLSFTASQTGTHAVYVTSYHSETGGPFTFNIGFGGFSEPDMHTGTATGNAAIGIGNTLSGFLGPGSNAYLPGNQTQSGPEYYRNSHSFTMTQNNINANGSGVTIALGTPGFDGFLYLIDPGGRVVTYDDDYISSTSSQISSWPCNDLGTWIIVVTSYDQGETGGYTLTTAQP